MKTSHDEKSIRIEVAEDPLVKKIEGEQSYLEFRPMDGEAKVVARILESGARSPAPSTETSTSMTSLIERADAVIRTSVFSNRMFTSSREVRPVVKRSNSWSGREDRMLVPVGDLNFPPKPHSTRVVGGTAGLERGNMDLPMSGHRTLQNLGKTGNEKSLLRQTNRGTERQNRRRELSMSEHSKLRNSLVKGAKSFSQGTNVVTKKTKEVFGKMKGKLKLPSRKDAAKMELMESAENLLELTGQPMDEISNTQISHPSRTSALSRSLSLTDVMAGCDSDNESKKNEGTELDEPTVIQDSLQSRPKPRTKKRDQLSASEHIPRKSGTYPQVRRKPRRSISSSRRDLGMSPSSPKPCASKDKLPTSVMGVALQEKEEAKCAIASSVVKKRRSREKDQLTQSEHIHARSKQVRRPSTSSWGELTLTESDDEFASDEKKDFNPHFSWDLSQLVDMENLLNEESEEEGTKTEKLKKAFSHVKKIITGSSKKDSSFSHNLCSNDSTCNVDVFNESYQQNFVLESIGSGLGGSRRYSSSSRMPELSDPNALSSDHDGRPPESVGRFSGRSGTNMDRNEIMERKGSSRSLKNPISGRRQSSSRSRRPSGSHTGETTSPPLTPRRSDRRRRNSMGDGDRKPSSWRELYSQSPGHGAASRPSSSRTKRQSRSDNVPSRNSSSDKIASLGMQDLSPASKSSPRSLIDREREWEKEEFTSANSSSTPRRQSSRRPVTEGQSIKRRGGAVKPGARDLELLQW